MRTETSLLASTREQNLLLRAQAALLAPVLIHIGTGILRYGLVIVLLWIGGMKFTAYEAAGIAPLEIHSPLVSWAYYLLGEAPSLISWGGDRDHSGYRDRASASKAAHFRHRKPCLGFNYRAEPIVTWQIDLVSRPRCSRPQERRWSELVLRRKCNLCSAPLWPRRSATKSRCEEEGVGKRSRNQPSDAASTEEV